MLKLRTFAKFVSAIVFVSIFLSISLGGLSYAAGTWTPQRTEILESHIKDVFFLSGGVEGWAVGSPQQKIDGTTFFDCWHTIDGGATWTGQKVGNNIILPLLTIRGVYFRDSNLGYAVGDAGLISKCTNSSGDGTWEIKYMGSTSNVFFDVYAPSDNVAWVCGADMPDPSNPSTWTPIILKTEDGGETWITMTLEDVVFADSSTGWAVGDGGVIIKTTDGGSSWSFQSSGTTKNLRAIVALSTTEAWVAGDDGTILHTLDGGTTWSSHFGANSVFALDASHIWVAGQQGLVLFFDGTSWTIQNTLTNIDLNAIHFANANYGWVVGDGGINLYTTNGGSTWTAHSSLGQDLNDVFVYDDTAGPTGSYLVWVCGNAGILRYTSDASPGGAPAPWSSPATPPPVQKLNGIEFQSASVGYVAGNAGTLAYTSDGGATWTNASGLGTTNFTDVTSAGVTDAWFATAEDGGFWQTRSGNVWAPCDLKDVEKTDANTEYYVGGGGTIIKRSTSTWSIQESGTSEYLQAVEFSGTSYGVAVGFNGCVRWTNDGGTTWNPVADGAFNNTDVSIVEDTGSPGTYYLAWVGKGGHIRHATHVPASATWTDRTVASTPPGSPDLLAVDFLNKDIGWALGAGGTVWQTMDGSSANPHWTLVNLNDVYSLSDGNTWWVGDGGTIIHYNGSNYSLEYNSSSWTYENLNSVFFFDSNNGYAVGDNGTVIHYSSGSWETPQQVGAPNPNLNSIFLTSSTDGYAVGDTGYYVQLSGGVWGTPTQVGGANPNLNSIFLTSSTDGYAVGDTGYYVQLTAGVWGTPTQVGGANPNLNSIFLTSSDAGYAVGDSGYYVQLSGGVWGTPTLVGDPNPNLYDLDLVGTYGFAVGGSGTEGYRVTISAGSFGTPVSMGSGTQDLTGIEFSSTSLAYTSGSGRTMWSYDASGPTWTKLSSLEGISNLNGFDINAASGYGWACGDSGTIYVFHEGMFARETSGVTNNLEAVSSVSSSVAYAVGDNGRVLKRVGTWSSVSTPTSNSLYGVDFTDANTGVIAGASRIVATTSNGASSWTRNSGIEGTTNDFLRADFVDSSNGWLCGQAGMIYRYENGLINPQSSGTTLNINGISMISTTSGFAVGQNRLILSTTDGSTWTKVSELGTTEDIYGASFISAGQGWFSGSLGLILHYDGTFTRQAQGLTSEDLYGISLVNDAGTGKGAAVGTGGVACFTQNNGANWTLSSTGHTEDFHAVSFASLTQGIACGENGRVILSSNGGQTWSDPASPPSTTSTLRDVDFGDSANNYAWIAGNNGLVFRSEDNGGSWTQQNSQTTNSLFGIYAMHDGANYIVWAVGAARTIVKNTTPAGSPDSWSSLSQIPGPSALFALQVMPAGDIYSAGVLSGYGGIIVHSSNGGATFSQELASGSPALYGISGYDATGIWVVGDSGAILRWNGLAWVSQAGVPASVNLRDVAIDYDGFTANYVGATMGSGGSIYYTTDSGTSWNAATSPCRNSLEAAWYERASGFSYGAGDSGTILRSVDNNVNWSYCVAPSNNLNGVAFADSTHGISCGEKGLIVYTSDGGTTWNAASSITSENLNGASMILDGATYRGIVVGNNSSILITSDGGATWSGATTGPPAGTDLFAVTFLDSTHAWAVGETGNIWFSADAGANWTQQTDNPTTNHLKGVHFYDANHGVAVGGGAGSADCVRWTDNGGINWYSPSTPPPSPGNLFAVSMGSESEVWAAGSGGSIWHSSDGGNNWQRQDSPVSNDFYGISFGAPGHPDTRNGLIVGACFAANEQAISLYTTDGGANWTQVASATGMSKNLNGISSVWDTDRIKSYSCGTWGRIQVYQSSLAAPSITPPLVPSQGTTGTAVTINGSNYGADQASVHGHVYFGGAAEATTISSWNDTQIVATVPDGAYTGNVYVVNDGGSSNGVQFTVVPKISNVSPTVVSGGTTVTITGTGFGDDPGAGNRSTATENVKVGTSQIPDASFNSWSNTEIKFTLPPDVQPGTSVAVKVTAGGQISAGLNVEVRPKITSLDPSSGRTSDEIRIVGTNFGTAPSYDDNNCVKMVKMDEGGGLTLARIPDACMVSWGDTEVRFKIPDDPAVFQPWTGYVRVTRNSSSSGDDPTLKVLPKIESTLPTSGHVGETVTINGSAFGEVQAGAQGKVYFNGVDAGTAVSWSYNQIKVKVPTDATSGPLKVRTVGGDSNTLSFTVQPVILSLSATQGRVGDSITISGSGFGSTKGTNSVSFNGVQASISSWSSSQIVAKVPASATTGNVVVTVNSVESNGINFKVLPKITSISPSSGIPGTTLVTINGYTFGSSQGTSKITFAGVDAGRAESWSSTEVKVKVPVGAKSGDVIVTTSDGSSNPYQFTAGPYISSISPSSGPPGISVTISGLNFGSDMGESKVKFNGIEADIDSWSDTSIEAKVPFGAKSGNVTVTTSVGESNAVAFSVTLPKSFYFAEGTTRAGFQEFLCLMNPEDSEAKVKITYMLSEGPNVTQEVTVPKKSRMTVRVLDVVGPDKDVSARVDSDKPIVAERPMYFNYNGVWTGGHDVVGAVSTSKEWYFAEGNTRLEFEEWICLQNPNDENAAVDITYMLQGGGTRVQSVEVPPKSRRTLSAKQFLGPNVDCAAKVTSNLGIIAERPMYFNYKNAWTGGHDVIGATSPSTKWYFAEGTTRDGFDEWLCLLNPGDTLAQATIKYMLETGETKTMEADVPSASRITIDVPGFLGRGHDVSVFISSTLPVVAERPMYFDYVGITGGHDVIGARSPAGNWYFAEGTTQAGFQEWISIQNPGDKDSQVTIIYMLSNGTNKQQGVKVTAHTRVTVDVNGSIGWGNDTAAKVSVDEGQPGSGIIVERPMYFNYFGWTGGHDVVGFSL